MDLGITTAIRFSYLAAASLVLAAYLLPPVRKHLLAYGARATAPKSSAEQEKEAAERKRGSQSLDGLLQLVACAQVPHTWFMSFYIVSVLLSLLWGSQLLSKGALFELLANHSRPEEQSSAMTVSQVKIIWMMMLVQGSRRLFECLAFHRTSQSKMWIGHWLLGIAFYAGMSIAVWIEGASSMQLHQWSTNDIGVAAPSFRTFVAILIFLMASGVQHDCHNYLASLKPPPSARTTSQVSDATDHYSIPSHPAFHRLLTPHYFCECLLYLCMSIVAAPAGQWVNKTIASAMIFVVVNLGVTAQGTKEWYVKRFGRDAIEGKRRMIPFVY